MRYYAVKLNGAPSSFTPIEGAYISGAQFCSVVNGKNDPSALRCQVHVEILAQAKSVSKGFVRMWGVPMEMLSQASDLMNVGIEFYGGFWPGLPLATKEAQYAGLIFKGMIQAGFGNWKAAELTLDMYCMPGGEATGGGVGASGLGPGSGQVGGGASGQRLRSRSRGVGSPIRKLRPPISAVQFDNPLAGIVGDIGSIIDAISQIVGGGWLETPANLIHTMTQGLPLDQVIKQALNSAFPNTPIKMFIKAAMTLPYDDKGFYQNVAQYAGYVKSLSKTLSGGDKKYQGVDLFPIKGEIHAADGTQPEGTVTLDFVDLIGQPTWAGDGTINFMTPMRADIHPNVTVNLPKNTLQYLTPGENPIRGSGGGLIRSLATTFDGPCFVNEVLVIGDSRHPAGESWCLSVTGLINGGPGGATASADAQGIANTISGIVSGFSAPSRLMARRRGIG